MFGKILKGAKIGFGKVALMLSVALVAVQNASAQLLIPAGTEAKLEGYITDNFGVVIAVVIAIVGAGLLIKLIRKAG
jgi:hypothetical protein